MEKWNEVSRRGDEKKQETRGKKEGMMEYWKNGMVVLRRGVEKKQEKRKMEWWNIGKME